MPYKVYFYRTANGRCEVRQFLRKLPYKHAGKCIDYLKRIRSHGIQLPRNIIAHIEQGVWEARPEYGGIEYRFFLFFHESHRIGVVSAVVKKRQRLDRKVIEQALIRVDAMKREWE